MYPKGGQHYITPDSEGQNFCNDSKLFPQNVPIKITSCLLVCSRSTARKRRLRVEPFSKRTAWSAFNLMLESESWFIFACEIRKIALNSRDTRESNVKKSFHGMSNAISLQIWYEDESFIRLDALQFRCICKYYIWIKNNAFFIRKFILCLIMLTQRSFLYLVEGINLLSFH